MSPEQKRYQRRLRAVWDNQWEILSAWAGCACPEGRCPIEGELRDLGLTPGDLLEASVLGQPSLLGLLSRRGL